VSKDPEKPLSAEVMHMAFSHLDSLLDRSVTLIMGGGGAMILAHQYPLATTDVDAIAKGIDLDKLDAMVKAVAKQLDLPPDWLNPYFSSFSYVIPEDFQKRTVEVFRGKRLLVEALGREEMLIMKCFAHRAKDRAHAKALLKLGVDMRLVENQMEALKVNRIPGTQVAMDFLDEMTEEVDEEGG